MRMQPAMAYCVDGVFYAWPLPTTARRGMRFDLLASNPSDDPSFDTEICNFADLVDPQLLAAARPFDRGALAAARQATGRLYQLAACEVSVDTPLRGADWGPSTMDYFGKSERVGDEDGINIGMMTRLGEECDDVADAATTIATSAGRPGVTNLRARLRLREGHSVDELEAARRGAATIAGRATCRQTRCALSVARAATRPGRGVVLLALIFHIELLNELCGARRRLRTHENATLIVPFTTRLLQSRDPAVRQRASNMLIEICYLTSSAQGAVFPLAYEAVRLSEVGEIDEATGIVRVPLVESDLATRLLLKMWAETFASSYDHLGAYIERTWRTRLGEQPSDDSKHNDNRVHLFVRRLARRVLALGAHRSPNMAAAVAATAAAETAVEEEAAAAEVAGAEPQQQEEQVPQQPQQQEGEEEEEEEEAAEGMADGVSVWGRPPRNFRNAWVTTGGSPFPGPRVGTAPLCTAAVGAAVAAYAPEGPLREAVLLQILREAQTGHPGWAALVDQELAGQVPLDWRCDQPHVALQFWRWFKTVSVDAPAYYVRACRPAALSVPHTMSVIDD